MKKTHLLKIDFSELILRKAANVGGWKTKIITVFLKAEKKSVNI